jgi:hypothetical protein
MEIKKVFVRGNDQVKLITIPKKSDIKAGDYVQIIKIQNKEEMVVDE